MTDARNIAHDKKVRQAKKQQGKETSAETAQPGRKPLQDHHAKDDAAPPETPTITSKEST